MILTKDPIEEIAREIRSDLGLPFPLTSKDVQETFLKIQEPTNHLYFPGQPDSYEEAKKAIDSITRYPDGKPESKYTETARQQVVLAVFMPKDEFLNLCSTYQKKGFLFNHIDFETVAKICHVNKKDTIERFSDLRPNVLL